MIRRRVLRKCSVKAIQLYVWQTSQKLTYFEWAKYKNQSLWSFRQFCRKVFVKRLEKKIKFESALFVFCLKCTEFFEEAARKVWPSCVWEISICLARSLKGDFLQTELKMKVFFGLLALAASEFRFFNESCGSENLEQEGTWF